MITPRDALLFAAVLWPSLRLPIALVDRGLELVGVFDVRRSTAAAREKAIDTLRKTRGANYPAETVVRDLEAAGLKIVEQEAA